MSTNKADKMDKEGRALAKLGIAVDDLAVPPAGMNLTTQQEAFVVAYVDTGGDRVLAAITAGYDEPGRSARALIQLPAIQAAIRREQAMVVAGMVAAADKTLTAIIKDPDADPRVRVAASRAVYERAGVVKQAAVAAERGEGQEKPLSEMTEAELEALIARAARRVADKASGREAPPVIDVAPSDPAPEAP